MMKKKLSLALVTITLLFSFLLSGCGSVSTGVPQSEFDQANAQLADTRAQLAGAQSTIALLQAEKDAMDGALQSDAVKFAGLENQLADLDSRLAGLQDQVSLTGATPADPAEKIVKYYHETHVYDAYDLFVCSDMAAEVWNMLEAQGISAVIAVGKVDQPISDILQCNHAWVLAEVAPGDYLALETTGGRVVTRAENPFYYCGWSFDSPADLKDYNRMIWEYNIRVELHNTVAGDDRRVVEEHNSSTDPVQAAELEAVHNELAKLVLDQESTLTDLQAQINSLAKKM
jgi:hypothetical protein